MTKMNGIQTLIDMCASYSTFYEKDANVIIAIKELKTQGLEGSRALARLIDELRECRSPQLTGILRVAEQLEPTNELLKALDAVIGATNLAPEPANMRFWPHIIGDGKVGWADGTASVVKGIAKEVYDKLTKAKLAE
jgi:predicted ABC-class ATPase